MQQKYEIRLLRDNLDALRFALWAVFRLHWRILTMVPRDITLRISEGGEPQERETVVKGSFFSLYDRRWRRSRLDFYATYKSRRIEEPDRSGSSYAPCELRVQTVFTSKSEHRRIERENVSTFA